MKVSELMRLLATCDPNALVVMNDTPITENDENIMEGAMQRVAAVETGWANPDIEWDITFSLRPIGTYLVPAIRLVGCSDQETDPAHEITINGVSAMKDVEVISIKKIGSR